MSDPREALIRYADRGTDDRAELDALLDDVPVGVLSTVVDGLPWSVPMLIARDGDRVLLHGSTGAGALRQSGQGAPVTLTVMSLDGLVLAWNAFDSSANYRSAVLRGTLVVVPDDEADAALRCLTDRIAPGRTAEVPASTRKELAATTTLALPIEPGSWLLKQRSGGSSPPDDAEVDAWTGVVPLRVVAGAPIADEWNSSGAPVPPSVGAVCDRHQ